MSANKGKWMGVLVAMALTVALAVPAYAVTGNGAPAGPHYSLNIIGVEKGKNPDMTGSQRHTIFVALGSPSGAVTTKIFLTQGDFRVCDGNGFDEATDCSGNTIAPAGAVFQLPCNTNLPVEAGVDLIPCDDPNAANAAYEIWARALGKPGGSATITTCATDAAGTICSTENVLLVRAKGKSTFTNVTKELTSLLAQLDLDPNLERVALFAGDFEEWFWRYDNKGLRLAQIRFYLLSDIKN